MTSPGKPLGLAVLGEVTCAGQAALRVQPECTYCHRPLSDPESLARAADVEYRRRRARDRKAAELRTRERDVLRARMVVADAKALLLEMPVEPFHVVLRRRMILCGWDPDVEGEMSTREIAEAMLDELGPDPLWREHQRVLLAGVVEPVGKPWKEHHGTH